MEALALIVGLYFLAAPVMGIVAFLTLRKSRGEARQLRARLTAATDRLDELTAALAALRSELGLAPAPEAETPAADAPDAAPAEPPEHPDTAEAERTRAAAREAFERSLSGAAPETAAPETESAETVPPETAPPETAPPGVGTAGTGSAAPVIRPGRTQGGLEESLTSRWLVWLGAVTIALGSIFLVKYSIERGWVGPAVRVAMGFASRPRVLLAVIGPSKKE